MYGPAEMALEAAKETMDLKSKGAPPPAGGRDSPCQGSAPLRGGPAGVGSCGWQCSRTRGGRQRFWVAAAIRRRTRNSSIC
jgi:hypothetical protein